MNREVLGLYYWVGHYVSVNSRIGAWKTNAIATISQQLQQELPGLTGFSETGIKDMRIFYEAWAPYIDRQLPVAELDQILPIADFENRQPSVADLTESDIECYARESWNLPQLSLPTTEFLADSELSLPISPCMSPE